MATPFHRDYMVEVGHGLEPEGALGLLDKELVLL
jgi:hypothetical protein